MATETRRAEYDAPTTELLAGTVGDRCANCHAPLAADQRFCVECGERRGTPRFSYASMAALAPPPAAAAPGASSPHRPRFSSGATLIAGIATLLIAMGVGVLIGQNSNNSAPRASSPPVQVVTVGGGAAGASTTASANNATAAARSTTSTKRKVKPVVVHLTAKTQAKAAAAARQVIGAGAPKNPTIQQGQSCSAGQSGCSNGHFTGSFFNGG
jgi:hypothetical protein